MSEQLAQRIEPVREAPVVAQDASKPSEPIPTTFENKELPPSISKKPYLIKMLDLGFSKDHFEMPSLIAEANEFILSEIKRYHLKDDSESYEEIVNKYLKKIPDNTDDYFKMERLMDLMRIDKKLLEAQKEKERIMSADITDLNSKQLKARIEAI